MPTSVILKLCVSGSAVKLCKWCFHIAGFVLAPELNRTFRQISTCDVLNRLAGGLTFVGLFILESGGYRPIRATNSTDHGHQRDDLSQVSITHIRAFHCFFPAACVAVAGTCLFFFYRLNRSEHSKLVKIIDASAI